MKNAFNLGKAPLRARAQVIRNRQERKHRRFHLECPVCVKFQAANCATEVETISRNLSIGGQGLDEPARIHTVYRYTDLLIYNVPAFTDLVPELLRQPCLETLCLASQWNR